MDLKERILDCKTASELNSLRLLIVRDKVHFRENQAAFIKMSNKLKRVPLKSRGEGFGQIYDPGVEQQTE